MAFLPNSGEFATLAFTMFSFGFILPAIAAIMFPFRKKQIYETSFVAKKKFLLPLISWLGLGSAMYLIWSTYLAHQWGTLPFDSFSETMYGTIYVLGAIVLVAGVPQREKERLTVGSSLQRNTTRMISTERSIPFQAVSFPRSSSVCCKCCVKNQLQILQRSYRETSYW
jgi:hypothetical protein